MTSLSFRYQAIQPDGTPMNGTVTARSQEHAALVLQERGWFPTDIRATTVLVGRKTIPLNDMALGLRMLANLLEAGLPVGKTLAAFSELAPKSWSLALDSVRDAVRDGQTLSSALAAAPVDIPPLVIGILHAGEAGTGLGSAARRVAEVMEHTAATRSAIRGALAYPAVLTIAGSAAVVLMVGVVLPRFALVLGDLNQHLPRSTQIVLQSATTLRAIALPGVVTLGILAMLWKYWTRTDQGKVHWDAFLLRIPVVGPIQSSAATARATAAMASLLESGVPVAAALLHAARAAGNAGVASALGRTREFVMHGERMSTAVQRTDALTATAVRLIRAGEESGRLSAMLAHTATIEQSRAEQSVRAMVKLLEPTLILVFGGIIGLVAAALLQAVYAVRAG